MTPTQSESPDKDVSVKDKVQGVINLIRPAVQADGGDIELVDVTSGGVVQIRFHGACHEDHASQYRGALGGLESLPQFECADAGDSRAQ